MVNSTDTFWDIEGVSLQTLGWNITTWGGELQGLPPLRGDDITIPYRPGRVFQGRMPDSRTLTFDMWVQGSDSDGLRPTSATRRAEFEKNLKDLRALFWNKGKPFTLTKRWRDYGSSTVRAASTQGVYAGGFAPSMHGSMHASFSAEVFLPDPFFYGSEVSINFPATATSTVSPNILGDYEATDIVLDVNATRNNFRLTNVTRGIYVNVARNVTSTLARLDVSAFTAVQNPNGTPVNIVSNVTQFGHTFWMALEPGVQQLSLTSSSGTSSAVLRYKPRYL